MGHSEAPHAKTSHAKREESEDVEISIMWTFSKIYVGSDLVRYLKLSEVDHVLGRDPFWFTTGLPVRHGSLLEASLLGRLKGGHPALGRTRVRQTWDPFRIIDLRTNNIFRA
jgi:hypothetical protein